MAAEAAPVTAASRIRSAFKAFEPGDVSPNLNSAASRLAQQALTSTREDSLPTKKEFARHTPPPAPNPKLPPSPLRSASGPPRNPCLTRLLEGDRSPLVEPSVYPTEGLLKRLSPQQRTLSPLREAASAPPAAEGKTQE